jgi:hypothetical protein
MSAHVNFEICGHTLTLIVWMHGNAHDSSAAQSRKIVVLKLLRDRPWNHIARSAFTTIECGVDGGA